MIFEGLPGYEEEKEPLQMTQEDYDKLRVLATEDSESDGLSALLEQYGLEVYDDESVEVMIGGQVTELEGFKYIEKPGELEDEDEMDMEDDLDIAA